MLGDLEEQDYKILSTLAENIDIEGLRKIREKIGYTQKQLALEIRVAPETVNRWERKKTTKISQLARGGIGRAFIEFEERYSDSGYRREHDQISILNFIKSNSFFKKYLE